MNKKINYNDTKQVLKFTSDRFHKVFTEIMEVYDGDPNFVAYELQEIGFRMRDSILNQCPIPSFQTDEEREILLNNLCYALMKTTIERDKLGLPLVLESDMGHGPYKDLEDVLAIALDRYPDYKGKTFGQDNAYGVDPSMIRVWSAGAYLVNTRSKKSEHQMIFVDKNGMQSLKERQEAGLPTQYRYDLVGQQRQEHQQATVQESLTQSASAKAILVEQGPTKPASKEVLVQAPEHQTAATRTEKPSDSQGK